MTKILIVDDNAVVLHVMLLLLGSHGFEVEVTTKGEQTFKGILSHGSCLTNLYYF